MNLAARLNIVHVVCEESTRYNDDMRRSLLIGLYELADSCREFLIESGEDCGHSKAMNELEVMKNICERSIQSGDFSDAFRLVGDASRKVGNIPEDSDP